MSTTDSPTSVPAVAAASTSAEPAAKHEAAAPHAAARNARLARALTIVLGLLLFAIVWGLSLWFMKREMVSTMAETIAASVSEQAGARANVEKGIHADLKVLAAAHDTLKERIEKQEKRTASDHEAVEQALRRSVSPAALDQIVSSLKETEAALAELKTEVSKRATAFGIVQTDVQQLSAYLGDQLYPAIVAVQTKVSKQEVELQKLIQLTSEPVMAGVAISAEEDVPPPTPTVREAPPGVAVQPGATMPARGK